MPRQATDSKETIKLAVSALMEVATVDETGKNIEVAVLRRGCVPALLPTCYARRNRQVGKWGARPVQTHFSLMRTRHRLAADRCLHSRTVDGVMC